MNELLNWQQKLFLPSYFGIYRMFLFKTGNYVFFHCFLILFRLLLFKTDNYMLIIKLDVYTKSLLDM
jgi:hypothetical protein